MSKLDINSLREQVTGLINSNRDCITSFEHADDYSIFTFCGKDYACAVTLNDTWIGYDLLIGELNGSETIRIEVDTDNYPINRPEHKWFAQEIYKDLMLTVKALLSAGVSYSADANETYYARRNEDGSCFLRHVIGKRRWLFKYAEVTENEEASEDEVLVLKLDTIS